MIDANSIKKYASGQYTEQDEYDFCDTLNDIAKLVIKRYYYYLSEDNKLEALSVAICGVLEVIRKDYVDLEHNDPVSFVFSRMRNVLTNFFRKNLFRETCTDQEILEETEVDPYNRFETLDIETRLIQKFKRLQKKLAHQNVTVNDICYDILNGEVLLKELPQLERTILLVCLGRTLGSCNFLPYGR